jgi:hypothetical protein
MAVLKLLFTRRHSARVGGLLAVAMLALAVMLHSASAQAIAAPVELQASESRLKAAFVYKFGDYVEWPAQAFDAPDSPLVIGVVGDDALAQELVRISQGHTIDGRRVAVKRLRHGDPLSGLHVVFIGASEARRAAQAIEAGRAGHALTITEIDDGLRLGSVINFVVVANKVRFDVALPSADASGLKISSRLLAVARTVVVGAP